MNRIQAVFVLLLIVFLVCAGLRLAEKGIDDTIITGEPRQALELRLDAPGVVVIIFAGKRAVINCVEIYHQIFEIWDRLSDIWNRGTGS